MRSVFKAELKKIWLRPMIILAFVLLCASQLAYVLLNYDSDLKEYAEEYNSFSGDRYTPFMQMLDEVVKIYSAEYGEFAEESFAGLREAGEEGRLVFGYSPAAQKMTDQYMVALGFLVFMLLLCSDMFSGEKESGMYHLQSVTKQGRRQLFLAKLAVCQTSALLAWLASNLIYAAILTGLYGWGNIEGVIQDFSFNTCPYDMNSGEYLASVLALGFIASQLSGIIIFIAARLTKTTKQAAALVGGLMLLPYMLAFATDNICLAIWTPCLMNGRWLWDGLHAVKLGGGYVHLWHIACLGLLTVLAATAVCLYKIEGKNYEN